MSFRFTFKAVCAAAVISLAAVAASAQRLPQNVVPEHYTLHLTPDLKAATFTGDETIDVTLKQPSNTVVLNALEITFQSVTAGSQTAKVTLDPEKEQATFTFDKALPAGKNTLHIQYNGILNGKLRGFYLSKTEKRNYAVTQFESTDARRAYPSFDEPALKATYTVELTVDAGDTAISNTNIVSDTPAGEGKHTLTFATTPKMSTYLVAFLVGDFKCLVGKSDETPIRVCATPDKVQYGQLALQATEFILHYYNDYFGIKYPMPKLDMIALPDFEAGAMENFGAITYRETDLLADDKTASLNEKKRVAVVVAHEMAHQWFGDLVTMQWWDNLWLNEGFATWMESKAAAAFKPEWNYTVDDAQALDAVLNLDAQKRTRTIRAEANTPAEINEMFDGITYQKGGAVIGMVENYVGEETFRQGVHNYLAAHLYGNATAEDFWNAQTKNSGKPVDVVMSSFVTRPGVPLLTFATPQGAKSQVSQQRFFITPSVSGDTQQVWSVPVCVKTSGNEQCELLKAASEGINVPRGSFFYGNANGKGYYRSQYSPEAYQALVASVETSLKPEERISVIGDEWALTRAGKASVGDVLALAQATKDDPSAEVVESTVGKIGTIYRQIASEEDRTQLQAWVRETYGPAYQKVRTPKPDDSLETRQMRATLFGVLGGIGEDPAVITEAKELANRFVADQTSVEPSLGREAVEIAAQHGDAALYDKIMDLSKTSNDPSIKAGALQVLTMFRDPALVKRTLDYATSGQVRNQDSIFLFVGSLQGTKTRDEAWQYIQQNWDRVQAQLTMSTGGYLVGSTGAFCSSQKRDEVNHFFAAHKVTSSERALQRANDAIMDCVALHDAQQPKLAQWLSQQHLQASTGTH